MSQPDRLIRRANEMLRELDGVFPGGDGVHQQFQWKWSEDLWTLIPQYEMKSNGEAEPIMEHRCGCGVDIRVHSANCSGITIAKIKLQNVKTTGEDGEFASYKNVWILCTFVPPPLKSDWIDSMGTDEDYPANGRYLPVHRGPACVAIPPRTSPQEYERATRVVITMMREHADTWRASLRKQTEKMLELQIPIEDHKGNVIREPGQGSKYQRIKDKVKDSMRRYDPDATVGYTKALEAPETKENVNV